MHTRMSECAHAVRALFVGVVEEEEEEGRGRQAERETGIETGMENERQCISVGRGTGWWWWLVVAVGRGSGRSKVGLARQHQHYLITRLAPDRAKKGFGRGLCAQRAASKYRLLAWTLDLPWTSRHEPSVAHVAHKHANFVRALHRYGVGRRAQLRSF